MRLWLSALARDFGRPPGAALLGISLAGWAIYTTTTFARATLPPFCGSRPGGLVFRDTFGSADAVITSLGDWALMMLAMMPLLLAQPVRVLVRGSLARNRPVVLATFAGGYALVWLSAGVLLLAASGGTRALFAAAGRESLLLPVTIAIAVVWQISHLKRRCLGRCHHVPTIRVFCPGATADAFTYGITSGFWCFGTCWLLMLVSLVADKGHMPIMAVVAALATAERHFGCAAPADKTNGLGRRVGLAGYLASTTNSKNPAPSSGSARGRRPSRAAP